MFQLFFTYDYICDTKIICMQNRWLFIPLVSFILLVIFYISFRNSILTSFLQASANKIKTSNEIQISYKKVNFEGLKTICIHNILISIHEDTIFSADSIILNPKILSFLLRKKRFSELCIYNADCRINSTIINYLKLHYKHDTLTSLVHDKKSNFASYVKEYKGKIFNNLPTICNFRNITIKYTYDSIKSTYYIDYYNFKKGKFVGKLLLSDLKVSSKWFITGNINSSLDQIDLSIKHIDKGQGQLPCIQMKNQTFLGFDSLDFSIKFKDLGNELQILTGKFILSNLNLKDNRIGPDIVKSNYSSFSYSINVGKRFFEIDSSSCFCFNQFSFSPYLRIEKDSNMIVNFEILKKEFEASNLFESLPDGLFSNFKGIRTKGKLCFYAKLKVNLNHPDSIYFDANLENKGFSVLQYGVTDFRKINESFIHDVYENDQYIRSICVGSENPDFVPLDEISPYLKYAILTSEDGDFYYHHGFNEKAFRESISKNLKEHRFARGGSTISMQMVKNVFLNRNKTISRKLEEAMIVWLIENQHLVSKDRMFEVYLNIIEWGPFIYGIKPAAKFYFNKLPKSLTLSESIYLTSIIPRPKAFKYTFIHNGEMAGFYESYSKLLTSIMLHRNQITADDSASAKPFVKLTGIAKNLLLKNDSTLMKDSLFYPTSEELMNEQSIIQDDKK